MKCIYAYYKVRPLYLRERLGVDNILLPTTAIQTLVRKLIPDNWDGGSGVLPPDLFAVLYQDGFEYSTVSQSNHRESLCEHFNNGGLALGLLFKYSDINTFAGFHWVVLAGMTEKGYWVADSNGAVTKVIPFQTLAKWDTHYLAVNREAGAKKRTMTYRDYAKCYAEGTAWGTKSIFTKSK